MLCESCEYNKRNINKILKELQLLRKKYNKTKKIISNIREELKEIKISDNDSINKYFT